MILNTPGAQRLEISLKTLIHINGHIENEGVQCSYRSENDKYFLVYSFLPFKINCYCKDELNLVILVAPKLVKSGSSHYFYQV